MAGNWQRREKCYFTIQWGAKRSTWLQAIPQICYCLALLKYRQGKSRNITLLTWRLVLAVLLGWQPWLLQHSILLLSPHSTQVLLFYLLHTKPSVYLSNTWGPDLIRIPVQSSVVWPRVSMSQSLFTKKPITVILLDHDQVGTAALQTYPLKARKK